LAYKVVYKKSVQRDLKRLGKAEARTIIRQIEKELPGSADTYPMMKGQFAGLRRYRFSDYRVVFALLDNEVVILRAVTEKMSINRSESITPCSISTLS
jgi:mRNA-degrading endonuclease RelE of RelBE toxin-antitoxin system